ncbi:IclR family transcriptional regulator [Inhella proteolytica]|uniref:IclR family transcriptional regulator n=1 Tax=Inhella proteolytica TaxID=2795029 RepID=A0A931J6Z7_9BURK|nr:IclR family transcriptional regulator [Inhella proteolytica]MBH9577492.1 IclR family transcriptional regulator [Inhella proteolytica]
MNPSRARGIQSIEVGGTLLRALMDAGGSLALKDLAQAAGMPPAKAHAYLVSFCRLGLIEQPVEGGPYALGPTARELGLISLQQHDPVRLTSEQLEPLAQQLGMTVGLAVWGNQGPTVLRVAHPPAPVHIHLRHGSVLSVADSASGRVLAAARAWDEVGRHWRGQASAGRLILETVQQQGWALSDEALAPGVAAVAVPVHNAAGRVELALVALAPRQQWLEAPGRPQGVALEQLLRTAQACSAQLGYTPRRISRSSAVSSAGP